MSHISKALRRADRAESETYLPYRAVISAKPRTAAPGRKRLMAAICLASLVIAGSTGFALICLYNQDNARLSEYRAKLGERPVEAQSAPDPARAAELIYQAALRSHEAGALHEAETLYRRALERDPQHLDALNNLGVLCMTGQRNEEAITLFNRVIAVDRDGADPYYNLACLYSRQGDITLALRYLRAAVQLNSDIRELARTDSDLDPLRSRLEFEKLIR